MSLRLQLLRSSPLLASLIVSTAHARPQAPATDARKPAAEAPQPPPPLRLHALFRDHMVLQQRSQVPLWGVAKPGSSVQVRTSWDQGLIGALADRDGRFTVHLTTPAAGGPFSIEVSSDYAVQIDDVWIGEVWLGSGQSNMEMPVGDVQPGYRGVRNWQQEVQDAKHPQIRLFTVKNQLAPQPAEEVEGKWQVCSPATVSTFSASLYFFGRRLQRELGVPIGLIAADWGGTPAESWVSARALRAHGGFDPQLDALASAPPPAQAAQLRKQAAAWWQAQTLPDAQSPAWLTTTLPRAFSSMELGDFDGLVWFERALELAEDQVGKDLHVTLGPIDDQDGVFLNGKLVAGTLETGRGLASRRYTIPAAAVQQAKNRLAVLVLDLGGEGGLTGKPEQMALRIGSDGDTRSLAGEWRWLRGKAKHELVLPPAVHGFDASTPSVLHQGMIAPLGQFTLRGVLWYQGESNRMRAAQYRTLFPALIQDFRAQWRKELPFFFVQIAPYGYPDDTGQSAELRLAQQDALALPATGMVVTTDIGNPADIHPIDKQTVGDRLARLALTRTYGKAEIACESPRLVGSSVEQDAIRVRFEHAGSGLVAKDGPLQSFTIAGADRRFVAAEATIDGSTVLVRSKQVPEPKHVRFCWGAADASNLFNSEGLPAGPFRTDR